MSRSAEELPREALVHMDLAVTYADTHEPNQLVIDATCMRLSIEVDLPDIVQTITKELSET